LIIHIVTGKIPVLLCVDAFNGNVQAVQPCINDFQTALWGQQGSVCCGVQRANTR
jgi:hypothetical protein